MYDFTYVENVAHAHICAEQTLASEGSKAEEAAGKVYTSLVARYICVQNFKFSTLVGLQITCVGPFNKK